MIAEDTKKSLDKRTNLRDAISRFVFDGCSIAFGGMGGMQLVAPTYEIVRQGQKELTLMGDSPCECADYLVGTGRIRRVEVAWLAFAVAGVQSQLQAVRGKGDPSENRSLRVFKLYDGLRFWQEPWGCRSWSRNP